MRNVKCWVLLAVEEECEHCKLSEKQFSQMEIKNNQHLVTPAKVKASLTKTSRERVIATLQFKRLQCKQTKLELEKMKIEIKKSSVNIDKQLSDDFTTIFSNAKDVTPFMKLFWQQHQPLMKTGGTNVKYHPMIIRYRCSKHAYPPPIHDRNLYLAKRWYRRAMQHNRGVQDYIDNHTHDNRNIRNSRNTPLELIRN